MAATRIEIGDHLYLFCQERTFAPRLVITSHGAESGTFDTEKRLLFYTHLGDAMDDETIAAITRGTSEPQDEITAGTTGTEDYRLDKYQTSVGDGPESYDSLLDEMKRLARGREEDLFDVVTVRNRRGVKSK